MYSCLIVMWTKELSRTGRRVSYLASAVCALFFANFLPETKNTWNTRGIGTLPGVTHLQVDHFKRTPIGTWLTIRLIVKFKENLNFFLSKFKNMKSDKYLPPFSNNYGGQLKIYLRKPLYILRRISKLFYFLHILISYLVDD